MYATVPQIAQQVSRRGLAGLARQHYRPACAGSVHVSDRSEFRTLVTGSGQVHAKGMRSDEILGLVSTEPGKPFDTGGTRSDVHTYRMATVKTVLVTGGTGFLGAEIVKQLLDRGYNVRCAVRKVTETTTGPLESLAAALPGNLELVHVADIAAEDAYDAIVSGVSFIIHTASPVSDGIGDPDKDHEFVVLPAVRGTVNLLQSAARLAQATLQRIVLTSSTATVIPHNHDYKGSKVYKEDMWNTESTLENKVYHFSKVQAEKAAWEIACQANLDLVTILPSLLLGPVTIKRDGISVEAIKSLLETGLWGPKFEELPWAVDVRDAAAAHIAAMETPSAKGRYLISHSHTANWRESQLALQSEFPTLDLQEVPASEPRPVLDSSRAERELRIHYLTISQSIVDQARTELQLGIAKPKIKA